MYSVAQEANMRVLCVGIAVLSMVCPVSAFSQGVELQPTAELPAGVPDSTEWPGEVMIMTLNIANPAGEKQKNDPFVSWMIAQGICPNDENTCSFGIYADSSGRTDAETHVFEHVVRVVARNESGKLVECLGYWAGADNIVQRQSFWLRSGGQWRKRTAETNHGVDVLLNSDVLFSLRVAAVLKKLRSMKSE